MAKINIGSLNTVSSIQGSRVSVPASDTSISDAYKNLAGSVSKGATQILGAMQERQDKDELINLQTEKAEPLNQAFAKLSSINPYTDKDRYDEARTEYELAMLDFKNKAGKISNARAGEEYAARLEGSNSKTINASFIRQMTAGQERQRKRDLKIATDTIGLKLQTGQSIDPSTFSSLYNVVDNEEERIAIRKNILSNAKAGVRDHGKKDIMASLVNSGIYQEFNADEKKLFNQDLDDLEELFKGKQVRDFNRRKENMLEGYANPVRAGLTDSQYEENIKEIKNNEYISEVEKETAIKQINLAKEKYDNLNDSVYVANGFKFDNRYINDDLSGSMAYLNPMIHQLSEQGDLSAADMAIKEAKKYGSNLLSKATIVGPTLKKNFEKKLRGKTKEQRAAIIANEMAKIEDPYHRNAIIKDLGLNDTDHMNAKLPGLGLSVIAEEEKAALDGKTKKDLRAHYSTAEGILKDLGVEVSLNGANNITASGLKRYAAALIANGAEKGQVKQMVKEQFVDGRIISEDQIIPTEKFNLSDEKVREFMTSEEGVFDSLSKNQKEIITFLQGSKDPDISNLMKNVSDADDLLDSIDIIGSIQRVLSPNGMIQLQIKTNRGSSILLPGTEEGIATISQKLSRGPSNE